MHEHLPFLTNLKFSVILEKEFIGLALWWGSDKVCLPQSESAVFVA